MRLLQRHEHLRLLEGGVAPVDLDGATSDACLRAAAAVWPETALATWGAADRRVVYACRSHRDGHVLCHVNADHRDCFLIVVLAAGQQQPEAYIVLDIGAEYRQPIFICPSARYEGVATEDAMAAAIPNLMAVKDAFAILELSAGTYMQTSQDGPDRYVLEHQLVTIRNHYQVPHPVDAATVVEAFRSYAFGRYEWASNLPWELMRL